MLAPDNVWALDPSTAGVHKIRHWDGVRWTIGPLPLDATGVAASGPADVWAWGSDDDGSAAFHFDGKAWRKVEVPAKVSLDAMVAVAPQETWLLGRPDPAPAASGPSAASEATAAAFRWDGSAWRPDPAALLHGGRLARPTGAFGQGWVAGQAGACLVT